MKPEKLVMSGWGPYKDMVTVDFTKFENDNLFLITGQTGAGKTTIFDAITYALYGVLSGEVREKQTVRSDFATADIKTYVELRMVHQGKTYCIYRNPEYERPKKRSSGDNGMTKEKENASIDLIESGKEPQNIAAGNVEVTKKVTEIMGMDARQFRQISMIAQGEFAKMILASPSEKTVIFRQIFGTNIYATVQEKLKSISTKLRNDYDNCCNRMNENIRMVQLENDELKVLLQSEKLNYDRILELFVEQEKAIVKQVKESAEQERKTETRLLALQEQLAKGKEINKDFVALESTRNKLLCLEKEGTTIKELEKEVSLLKTAQALAPLKQQRDLLAKGVAEIKNAIVKLEGEILKIEAEQKELELFYKSAREIEKGYDLKQQLNDCCSKKTVIEEKILWQNKDLKKKQEAFVVANDEYEKIRLQYDNADALYKKAVIGLAAQMVVEGEPCPVCGSLEHPKVAKLSENVLNEQELEDLKSRCDELWQKRESDFAKAQEVKRQTEVLEEQKRILLEEETQFTKELLELPEFVYGVLQSMSKTDFSKKTELYVNNKSVCVTKEQQKNELLQEVTDKEKEVENAGNQYFDSMKNSGFETEEILITFLNKLQLLSQYEEKCSEYYLQLASTKELCLHLENKLENCHLLDLSQLELEFERVLSEKNVAKEKYNEVNKLHENISNAISGMKSNLAECKKIETEYSIYKDLDGVANGNNPKRMVFEQYVLAKYFEEILKVANVRLHRMTAGRYELRRAQNVSDGRKKDSLEIVVMDFYTGKERSAKTLSGGEIFKASLALALGMSDCIQARKGGIVVDALFIDEGFGALDEESLEQACLALQQLAESNRMIGIISHVAELRERISNQIVIEKKTDGSSLSVIAI